MPSGLMGKDVVFKQFKPLPKDNKVKFFKYCLRMLPIIEENQDIYSLITLEVEKMQNDPQKDFVKLERLQRFKTMIEDYSKANPLNVY